MPLLGSPLTIGVDLGRRTTKVVAVRNGTHPLLVCAAAHPTPRGAIEEGTIRDVPAAAAALRAALRRAGIRKGRAVVGIGGQKAVVRHLTLPLMPPDELKDAVRWEAERHLPFRVEETVLDAQVLQEVTEDGQRRLEVLMAAVPERDALLYHQVVEAAGLDVAAIEVSSLALARTLGETEAVTAAIDVGSDSTEIVIAYRTLPLICRTLPVGSDHLSADASGGAAGPGGEAASAPGLQDLLEGLARSVDYFKAQARGKQLERVVVTWEVAATSDVVVPRLTAELGVPVEAGDPLGRLGASTIPQDIRERSPSFAAAIGLALRVIT